MGGLLRTHRFRIAKTLFYEAIFVKSLKTGQKPGPKNGHISPRATWFYTCYYRYFGFNMSPGTYPTYWSAPDTKLFCKFSVFWGYLFIQHEIYVHSLAEFLVYRLKSVYLPLKNVFKRARRPDITLGAPWLIMITNERNKSTQNAWFLMKIRHFRKCIRLAEKLLSLKFRF